MNNLKKIITKKQYNYLFLFLILMFVNALMEFISIGILLPFLTLLFEATQGSNIFQNLFNYFFSMVGIENSISNCIYLMFILFLIKYLFIIVYSKIQVQYLTIVKRDLQTKMFAGYLDRPYQFHVNNNSSKIIRNITTEVAKFSTNYLGPILGLALSILMVFLISLALLFVNFKATLIILFISMVSLLILNLIYSKKLKDNGLKHQHHDRYILQYLRQGLISIIETKTLSLEKIFTEMFFRHQDAVRKIGISRYMMGIVPKIYFEFLFLTIIFSFILYAVNNNILIDNIIITLTIYAAAAFRILPMFKSIADNLQKIKYAEPTVSLLTNELASIEKNKIDNIKFKSGTLKKIIFNKSISINNLFFSYNTNNREIIKNVNLKILKKEKIGIIGGNGSGKTTLLSLICGLLKPTKGTIKLDDIEILDNFDEYKKLIGYIPQNINLIDDTIEKNITLGIKNSTDYKEKLISAIDRSQLKKLISTLPQGLKTMVGENGVTLSGGEKQKIAIARTLFRESEILIFDEVTSAMDLESEKNFIEEINKVYVDKTIIIVSHRLSALKYCKKIFNMDNNQYMQKA